MGLLKTVLVPVCLSLGLHAVMGWSLGHYGTGGASREPSSIQISYPELPKAQPKLSAPPAPAPKQKFKGIPIPRHAAAPDPVPAPAEPSDFQKQLDAKLKKQQAVLSRLSADPEEPEPRAAAQTRPKTGAEIMADPQKGKVFIGYFGEIKKKIQYTLAERFAQRYTGKGSVALGFVLSSQGFVEKVSVLPRGTEGDPVLHELAIQCLRESAPFGPFPPALGSERIAFNVTIFFDGR